MSAVDRERFYAERDRRSHQYGAIDYALAAPIALVCSGAIASTRTGQAAIVSLIEMLARAHRNITVVTADPPLLIDALTEAGGLRAAIKQRAAAIDPYINIDVGATIPPADAIVLGIGASAPTGLDLYAGWTGGLGVIDLAPVTAGETGGDLLGAATAACLAAAALFRLVHGGSVSPARVNLATRTSGDCAGTTTLLGPIDAGEVVIIGAGAVTHALAYWTRVVGHVGRWRVVDADLAELHNTNRCLGMTAADAGWRSGVPGGIVRHKADIAADIVGALSERSWYDEWVAGNPPRPDLQLCLANERGIRAKVAQLGEPLLLHATTSANWTAELHRHIPGRDDCPACRIPETSVAQFACSTGPVIPATPGSADAALPFLSAAAGLMLAVALCQITDQGELLTGNANHWRLYLDGAMHTRKARWPPNDCPHVLASGVRAAVQRRSPRRWDRLDPGWSTPTDITGMCDR